MNIGTTFIISDFQGHYVRNEQTHRGVFASLQLKDQRCGKENLRSMNQSFFFFFFLKLWWIWLCIESTIHLVLKHHWLIWPVSSDVVLLPWFPSATVFTKALSVQNISLCSCCHYWPRSLPPCVTVTETKSSRILSRLIIIHHVIAHFY